MPRPKNKNKKTILELSEECRDCDICLKDCRKWVGYTGFGGKCKIHDVWIPKNKIGPDGLIIKEPDPYKTVFFRGLRRPYLKAHWCEEHRMFHCLRHAIYCMKIYGVTVMRWRPKDKWEEEEIKLMQEVDAETCKMQQWSDQIEFQIIRCAECKSSVCTCEPSDFSNLEVIG